jgi:hypothetical protein
MPSMADDGGNRNRRGFNTDGGGPNVPRPRVSPWIAIGVVVLGLVLFTNLLSGIGSNTIDYSSFIDAVNNEQIVGTVNISSSSVSGTLTENGQQK